MFISSESKSAFDNQQTGQAFERVVIPWSFVKVSDEVASAVVSELASIFSIGMSAFHANMGRAA
jgi:hypothetical protein